AAGVLAQIEKSNKKKQGIEWAKEEEEIFKNKVVEAYEREASPYYSTARLWDDGVIDPADTRKVLGLCLSASVKPVAEDTKYAVVMGSGRGEATNDSSSHDGNGVEDPDGGEAGVDNIVERVFSTTALATERSWKDILMAKQVQEDEEGFFKEGDREKLGSMKGSALHEEAFVKVLEEIWARWSPTLATLPQGFILAELKKANHVEEVLAGSPWYLKGVLIGVQRWSLRFIPTPQAFTSVAVWIRIHNLPIEYWERHCLFSIAAAIGKPIKIDTTTLYGNKELCDDL
ncbi:hypothetical protein Taro_014921, partial [Colocasia esculenta]|nr:hypothetical protein [Colocasia esculenta]